MNTNHVSIDIPFDAPIITSRTSGIILRTVVEFLSYFRKQMPFPFDTFQFMTAKIQQQLSNDASDDDLSQMKIDRQQRLAVETFHSLKTLLENVTDQIEKSDCLQAIVLFGATSLTPKEAFIINIPPATKYHHASNHQEAAIFSARSITMSLLTSQRLYDIESKLNITNMFVLLRSKGKLIANDLFQLNEDFRLPRSCKTIILNLKNVSKPISTNCCHHLVVFDDLINDYDLLKVSDNDCNRMNSMESIEKCEKDNDDCSTVNEEMWYESTVFLRGYKDVLVNGKSVWNL